jgi:gluconate 5-dehydrogenase
MADSLFDLGGRLALITGGGSGLGFAMATGLAEAGAKVIIVGRTEERLRAAVDKMRASGLPADYAVCDLLDRDAITKSVSRIEREVGAIDVLVNNAGTQERGHAWEFPADGWDRIIATHLSAPFFLSQPVIRTMIERKRGKIINTLSLMADLGRVGIVPYAAAKGGLRMLTRGLATELGPYNIQVNGIAPGYFKTDINADVAVDPAFDARVRSRTPIGRWGKPSELRGAVVFFASEASDFVTGQVMFVDGGISAAF